MLKPFAADDLYQAVRNEITRDNGVQRHGCTKAGLHDLLQTGSVIKRMFEMTPRLAAEAKE
jgi:hypothetical protein